MPVKQHSERSDYWNRSLTFRTLGFTYMTSPYVTRALDAVGAMDAENAPTALFFGDDFKNGQKTDWSNGAWELARSIAP